tara:strand:+ start:670 stop:912 length:243 start_codon:yes stop_codon:yes gene_type:complete
MKARLAYGYRFKNWQVELRDSKGSFFANNRLMFKGQSHDALKFFVDACDHPLIYNKFRNQARKEKRYASESNRTSNRTAG